MSVIQKIIRRIDMVSELLLLNSVISKILLVKVGQRRFETLTKVATQMFDQVGHQNKNFHFAFNLNTGRQKVEAKQEMKLSDFFHQHNKK